MKNLVFFVGRLEVWNEIRIQPIKKYAAAKEFTCRELKVRTPLFHMYRIIHIIWLYDTQG